MTLDEQINDARITEAAERIRWSAVLAAGDALSGAVAALGSRIGCGCGGDFLTCNACDRAVAEAEKAAEAWSALRKAANEKAHLSAPGGRVERNQKEQ